MRSAHHAGGVVLQVDGQRRLHGAAARHHGLGLQHPLDHAEGVVQRALHLVAHEVVGAAQDDGGRRARFGAEREKQQVSQQGCIRFVDQVSNASSSSLTS